MRMNLGGLKKPLSFLLALSMAFTMLPSVALTANAEEIPATEETEFVDITNLEENEAVSVEEAVAVEENETVSAEDTVIVEADEVEEVTTSSETTVKADCSFIISEIADFNGDEVCSLESFKVDDTEIEPEEDGVTYKVPAGSTSVAIKFESLIEDKYYDMGLSCNEANVDPSEADDLLYGFDAETINSYIDADEDNAFECKIWCLSKTISLKVNFPEGMAGTINELSVSEVEVARDTTTEIRINNPKNAVLTAYIGDPADERTIGTAYSNGIDITWENLDRADIFEDGQEDWTVEVTIVAEGSYVGIKPQITESSNLDDKHFELAEPVIRINDGIAWQYEGEEFQMEDMPDGDLVVSISVGQEYAAKLRGYQIGEGQYFECEPDENGSITIEKPETPFDGDINIFFDLTAKPSCILQKLGEDEPVSTTTITAGWLDTFTIGLVNGKLSDNNQYRRPLASEVLVTTHNNVTSVQAYDPSTGILSLDNAKGSIIDVYVKDGDTNVEKYVITVKSLTDEVKITEDGEAVESITVGTLLQKSFDIRSFDGDVDTELNDITVEEVGNVDAEIDYDNGKLLVGGRYNAIVGGEDNCIKIKGYDANGTVKTFATIPVTVTDNNVAVPKAPVLTETTKYGNDRLFVKLSGITEDLPELTDGSKYVYRIYVSKRSFYAVLDNTVFDVESEGDETIAEVVVNTNLQENQPIDASYRVSASIIRVDSDGNEAEGSESKKSRSITAYTKLPCYETALKLTPAKGTHYNTQEKVPVVDLVYSKNTTYRSISTNENGAAVIWDGVELSPIKYDDQGNIVSGQYYAEALDDEGRLEVNLKQLEALSGAKNLIASGTHTITVIPEVPLNVVPKFYAATAKYTLAAGIAGIDVAVPSSFYCNQTIGASFNYTVTVDGIWKDSNGNDIPKTKKTKTEVKVIDEKYADAFLEIPYADVLLEDIDRYSNAQKSVGVSAKGNKIVASKNAKLEKGDLVILVVKAADYAENDTWTFASVPVTTEKTDLSKAAIVFVDENGKKVDTTKAITYDKLKSYIESGMYVIADRANMDKCFDRNGNIYSNIDDMLVDCVSLNMSSSNSAVYSVDNTLPKRTGKFDLVLTADDGTNEKVKITLNTAWSPVDISSVQFNTYYMDDVTGGITQKTDSFVANGKWNAEYSNTIGSSISVSVYGLPYGSGCKLAVSGGTVGVSKIYQNSLICSVNANAKDTVIELKDPSNNTIATWTYTNVSGAYDFASQKAPTVKTQCYIRYVNVYGNYEYRKTDHIDVNAPSSIDLSVTAPEGANVARLYSTDSCVYNRITGYDAQKRYKEYPISADGVYAVPLEEGIATPAGNYKLSLVFGKIENGKFVQVAKESVVTIKSASEKVSLTVVNSYNLGLYDSWKASLNVKGTGFNQYSVKAIGALNTTINGKENAFVKYFTTFASGKIGVQTWLSGSDYAYLLSAESKNDRTGYIRYTYVDNLGVAHGQVGCAPEEELWVKVTLNVKNTAQKWSATTPTVIYSDDMWAYAFASDSLSSRYYYQDLEQSNGFTVTEINDTQIKVEGSGDTIKKPGSYKVTLYAVPLESLYGQNFFTTVNKVNMDRRKLCMTYGVKITFNVIVKDNTKTKDKIKVYYADRVYDTWSPGNDSTPYKIEVPLYTPIFTNEPEFKVVAKSNSSTDISKKIDAVYDSSTGILTLKIFKKNVDACAQGDYSAADNMLEIKVTYPNNDEGTMSDTLKIKLITPQKI